MDQEEALTAVDSIVTQFNTYEDFLDSQITTMDLYYLEVRQRRLSLPQSLSSPVVGRSVPPLAADCGTSGSAVSRPQGSHRSEITGSLPAPLRLSPCRIWVPCVT